MRRSRNNVWFPLPIPVKYLHQFHLHPPVFEKVCQSQELWEHELKWSWFYTSESNLTIGRPDKDIFFSRSVKAPTALKTVTKRKCISCLYNLLGATPSQRNRRVIQHTAHFIFFKTILTRKSACTTSGAWVWGNWMEFYQH